MTEITAFLLKKVFVIQRNYRIYQHKKRINQKYRKYRNIVKIQSIWRMYKCQKYLKVINEKEYNKLKKIGNDIVRITKWSKYIYLLICNIYFLDVQFKYKEYGGDLMIEHLLV